MPLFAFLCSLVLFGLAGAARADEAPTPPPLDAEPPRVLDRPVLPPLYSAHVAAGELPAPALQPASALTAASPAADEPQPTFLSADRVHGRTDVEMVAEGDAQLRRAGTVLSADRLTYWPLDDEVDAAGRVKLQKDDDTYWGPHLRLRVQESKGFFEHPSYMVPRMSKIPAGTFLGSEDMKPPQRLVTAHGEAERIDFLGEGVSRLSKATYTTCPAGNDAWHAEVEDLTLDYNRDTAEGDKGKVVFMDVPILYAPWLSFSLANQRKSGFLSPSIGSTSTSGAEVSLPWYWNIAPNMEAMITPRVMQKRGTQWNVDANYINYKYQGQSHVDYLPDDSITRKSRYGYSVNHTQDFGYGFGGTLAVNGVSDDNYFRDLTKPSAIAPQSQLLRQGALTYGGSWWGASLLAQRYQILQDPSLPPVAEPYHRVPQLSLSAARYDLPAGGAFNVNGEFVKFGHPTQVIGDRTTAYPQLSLPMQISSFMQFTPKVGLHETHYALQRQAPGTPDGFTRHVPIASADASVVLERETSVFGRSFTQTLEPRFYYLYVPFREQGGIPVFDTGVADYNYAQIFAENRYSGWDRIADANQLSATVTSRLIDPLTGAELARALIGQQYYFTTQRVTLPGEAPRTGRTADVVAAVSGQVIAKTWIDGGWQYNPRDKRTERLNLGGRYQPEIGKVLNAGYRFTRDQLSQIDVSGQWPLAGRWHGVGRYNYSLKENRMIESIGGVEYDGGCWILRTVIRRIATQTQQTTTALFVQLELNGLANIGSNPFDVLNRNVPGYWRVTSQQAPSPAFVPY